MNLLQEIKALFAVKDTVKEIEHMNIKSGWKTTEFWGKVGVQVMTLWGAVAGFIPPKYAVVIGASLEGIYSICRTVVKAVADVKASQTPA